MKRTAYPDIGLPKLYIGSTITVYSRQFKVVDYANDMTRNYYESGSSKMEKTLLLVKPDGKPVLGQILTILEN